MFQLMGTFHKAKLAAQFAGQTTYFTGKPCKNGHVAERYVSTSNCVICARAYATIKHAEVRAADPHYSRKKALKWKYNLSWEDFEKLRKKQGNRCAVCRNDFIETPFVDHCHRSSAVRNLLCRGCNTALGHARDNPNLLRALADYLDHHQSSQ